MKVLPDAQNRQYVRKVWIEDSWALDFVEESLSSKLPNLQGVYLLNGPLSKPLTVPPETTMRNLTSLGLSEIGSIPVQIFYHCHSLHDLKFDRSTLQVDIQERSPIHSPISSLHCLHIAGDSLPRMHILEWMLTPQCPFDLKALTTLRIADHSDELKAYGWTAKIVKLCASTLQDLMIDPPTSLAAQNPKLSTEFLLYPSTLSNLRIITISIIQEIGDYTNYVPWMNAFFSSLPVPNRLEEIHIPCLFTYRTPDTEDAHITADIPLYGWEALDTILSSSDFKLKRVVFGVYGLGKPSTPTTLASSFRESLPRLNGNGILEIVGSTEYGYFSEEDRWWYVKRVGIL
ncbi:hypothetical protein BDN72DRAFT_963379 [Pluteus cervinus]|uniref:Uncharacterized protein n=1 Tax=Pluteus cervinus TaxID=181527 RepID=A0ACD3AEX6_9AGAR|nr:hypothetical protein BDN72DRAFT_963379 [Pluteus cervinus]